jgi:peptidoglycan/LPS O-acetylase OafA/YrhL
MPLSEHEQRILEEIERRLVADDPKFAREVAAGGPQGTALKRVKRAVAMFVLGFALLIAGLLLGGNTLIFLGIGAFAVMVASAALIASGIKQVGHERPAETATRQGWLGRMEERWRKRYERGDST